MPSYVSIPDPSPNQKRSEVEQAIELLSHAVNVGDDKVTKIQLMDTFLKQHRTLQQSLVRLLTETLKEYGEMYISKDMKYHFDPRNNDAGHLCHKLFNSKNIHLPLI